MGQHRLEVTRTSYPVREVSMNCLQCAELIPESYITAWADSTESTSGVFRCPHCHAAHLRRISGKTPEGLPIYEFRLWGHPATTRRVQRIKGLTG